MNMTAHVLMKFSRAALRAEKLLVFSVSSGSSVVRAKALARINMSMICSKKQCVGGSYYGYVWEVYLTPRRPL
jgi:hypothetical protein